MAKTGRPSLYTDKLALDICKEVSKGKSLVNISKQPGRPALGTIHEWINRHKFFADNYARAREDRAEFLFQEILDIADDSSADMIKVEDKKGRKYMKVDHEHINRTKLRVDARKWYLSKLLPKKFSDRTIHAGDEDAPLTTRELNDKGKAVLLHFVNHHQDKLANVEDVHEVQEVQKIESDNIHYDKSTNYENKESAPETKGVGREVGSFSPVSPSGSDDVEDFSDIC